MADDDTTQVSATKKSKKKADVVAVAAGAAGAAAAVAGVGAAGVSGLLTDEGTNELDAVVTPSHSATSRTAAPAVETTTAARSSAPRESTTSRATEGRERDSRFDETDDPSLTTDFFEGGDRNSSTAAGSAPSLAEFVDNTNDDVRETARIVGDEIVAKGTDFVENTVPEVIEDFTAVETVNEGGARANLGSNGLDLGADVDIGFDSSVVDAGLKADIDLVVTGDRLNVGGEFDAGVEVPIVGGISSRFVGRVEGDEDGGSAQLGAGFELLGTGLSGDARLGLDTADGAHVVSSELGGEAHLGLIPGVVEVGVNADSTGEVGQQADGDYVAQVGLGTGLSVGVPGGPELNTRLGFDLGGEAGADGGSVNASADIAVVHVGISGYAEDGHVGVGFEIGAIDGEPIRVEVSDQTAGDLVEGAQEVIDDVRQGVQELAEDAEEVAEDIEQGLEDFGQGVSNFFGGP